MKKHSILFVFAFVITIFGSQTFAHGDCLTGKEFAKYRKANKKLIVIDARGASDYSKMHIMKSVSVPHLELYKKGEIKGLLKDPAALAAYFGKKRNQ